MRDILDLLLALTLLGIGVYHFIQGDLDFGLVAIVLAGVYLREREEA